MLLRFSSAVDVNASDIAKAIYGARTEVQVEILKELALLLDGADLSSMLQEVVNFANENESKALCRLARAINERDAGPSPVDEVN